LRLYAISDLHLGHAANREALQAMPAHPEDWLIVAGDTGDTPRHLEFALRTLQEKFARLIWVPGNHDLWAREGPRGEELYQQLVELCRRYAALTPEDPYVQWPGPGLPCLLAPLFLLYDYSFRPPEIPRERALHWAAESGVMCMDEKLLHPDPHASREAWCHQRCESTEARLLAASQQRPLVLINHWPLREDLAVLRRIPRFKLWCGTQRTTDWHLRYRAAVVVSGHLHIRSTRWLDGVRFEEVSLGYPAQWDPSQGLASYLREILPGPTAPGRA